MSTLIKVERETDGTFCAWWDEGGGQGLRISLTFHNADGVATWGMWSPSQHPNLTPEQMQTAEQDE